MTEDQTYLDFPGADALQAAGRVAPPSTQVLDAAMAAVRAAADQESARQRTNDQPRPTRDDLVVGTPVAARRLISGRRIAAVFAMAAVAAGLVVATSTTATPTGTSTAAPQHTADNGATAFLDGVAQVADAQPASAAPYWRVQYKNVKTGPSQRPLSSTATVYASRSGYMIESNGHVYKKGSAAAWSVGGKLVGWDGLDRLPTDPATLVGMLEAGQSDHSGAFDQAGTILGGSPAGPQLRAGLFQALGRLPGVKVVGTVRDSIGRSGTEVIYPGAWGAEALIIDPKTSTLLATVWWQADGRSDTTYLSTGPAMTIG
ncbi:hypothetical protein [Streptacidiphilus sp. EB129]|uniref:hypothetical protein n=1 Tax=Streptacidiphilus sp. EB129 TaxID=3156262 RepID=UPI003513351B